MPDRPGLWGCGKPGVGGSSPGSAPALGARAVRGGAARRGRPVDASDPVRDPGPGPPGPLLQPDDGGGGVLGGLPDGLAGPPRADRPLRRLRPGRLAPDRRVPRRPGALPSPASRGGPHLLGHLQGLAGRDRLLRLHHGRPGRDDDLLRPPPVPVLGDGRRRGHRAGHRDRHRPGRLLLQRLLLRRGLPRCPGRSPSRPGRSPGSTTSAPAGFRPWPRGRSRSTPRSSTRWRTA